MPLVLPDSRWRHGLAAIALVVLLGAVAAACSNPAQTPPGRSQPAEFPVEVSAIEIRHVEYALAAVGSVDAFERVQVTARVPGVVERVLFQEGTRVEAGQNLVEIEPERYRLAVEAAAARLAKAEAARREAELGLARRRDLDAEGLLAAEDLDAWATRLSVAAAEVLEAEAALHQAELNLRDAMVRSPVAGAIETRSVETGQYVQPGAVLTELVRREPLLLRFRATEEDAARLRAGMSARFTVAGDDRVHAATLTHVAGYADPATRMVAVTARIEGAERGALRPGAFAQVTVPVGAAAAPVVPQTAVRATERGFVVFVVEDGTARERVLRLGLRTADGHVEVREGLRPGEILVVRGAEALRDGVRVRAGGGAPS
jgi:RND family efflux transporter MFP subunit